MTAVSETQRQSDSDYVNRLSFWLGYFIDLFLSMNDADVDVPDAALHFASALADRELSSRHSRVTCARIANSKPLD